MSVPRISFSGWTYFDYQKENAHFSVLSSVSNFNMNRVSYMLYGDSTLSGGTIIWDFAQHEIETWAALGVGVPIFGS
jgi:hypothetical protein